MSRPNKSKQTYKSPSRAAFLAPPGGLVFFFGGNASSFRRPPAPRTPRAPFSGLPGPVNQKQPGRPRPFKIRPLPRLPPTILSVAKSALVGGKKPKRAQVFALLIPPRPGHLPRKKRPGRPFADSRWVQRAIIELSELFSQEYPPRRGPGPQAGAGEGRVGRPLGRSRKVSCSFSVLAYRVRILFRFPPGLHLAGPSRLNLSPQPIDVFSRGGWGRANRGVAPNAFWDDTLPNHPPPQ